MTAQYHIFTDGGCRGNGKGPDAVGSWAFIVYNQQGKRIGSKGQAKRGTTNNEMEMTAIYQAIKWAVEKGYTIEISTDSAFTKNGIESWMWGWARKGWVKADGSELKNESLWREIYHYTCQYQEKHGKAPTIHKVKGHSGDPRNTEVDALVNVKMDELEYESI
ncbi:ribonuclease H [Serratia phage vB_SmaM-Kamaji]|nr:ribonuclease H [Serratia phage vB_SmaM-Kamaji]